MKRLLLIIAIILMLPSLSFSSPYLVCDPYPADQIVTYFSMKVNGAPVQTPYALHASGAAIVYEVTTPGVINMTDIQACNARGCSEPPLVFTVPALPGQLNGIRLVP